MDTSQQWHLNADACIGRINPLEKEPEKETIVCPMMTFGGKDMTRPTMRESDCRLRLTTNVNCLTHCEAVDHLRIDMGIPIPEKIPPKERVISPPQGVCFQCGGVGISKQSVARCVPRPQKPICKECQLIARHIYLLKDKKLKPDVRHSQRIRCERELLQASWHSLVKEYVKVNDIHPAVKGWRHE